MFGVDSSELILVAILALIFIGPKDLPQALRTVGRWVGQIRGMARHFQTGIDAMIRDHRRRRAEGRSGTGDAATRPGGGLTREA